MIRRLARTSSLALLTCCIGGSVLNAAQPAQEISSMSISAINPEERIASYVKQTLQDWTPERAVELMKGHYAQLRLMDANGHWAAPELEAISDFLLPKDMDQEKIFTVVDTIKNSVSGNAYLHDFLMQAQNKDFPVFFGKVEADKQRVLPDVMAFAVVLDRLTKAMREDYTLIEVCQRVFKKTRNEANVWKYMSAFGLAKVLSIDYTVDKFVEFHKSGKVPADFGRNLAPLNIGEPCLVDLRLGHLGNARAGWSLIVNRPGSDQDNLKTGAGPTHWSQDGKAIDFELPLALHWHDLYINWILAFMIHRPYGPYMLMKILTPQVIDYAGHPQGFIYNRIIAVYVYLQWHFVRLADDTKQGKVPEEWVDESLLSFWGGVNSDNARKYDDELLAADPTWINWLNDMDSMFRKLK